MRGLLAAALGGVSKGAGVIADDQMAINTKKILMEAEEEMQNRIDEARANRDIANIPRVVDANALAEEGVITRRFGEGTFTEQQQRMLAAGETPAQKAQRESSEAITGATRYELQQKQARDELIQELATTTDPTRRASLIQHLTALGSEFKTPEMDPRDKMKLENLYTSYNDADKDYRKAIVETGDEEIVATLKAERDAIKKEIDNFGATTTPPPPPPLPEAEVPAAVESAVADFRAATTPEVRQQIMDLARQMGIEDQVSTALQSDQAPPADGAEPAPGPQEFQGYRIPSATVGGRVKEAGGMLMKGVVAPAVDAVSAASRAGGEFMTPSGVDPMDRARLEGEAAIIVGDMDRGLMPAIHTADRRAMVEKVLASRLLPPEYAKVLQEYLNQ